MAREFDVALRAQALTLHAEGASRAKITATTGYSSPGFSKLLQKAKARGYVVGGPVLLEYVAEEPRLGRPKGLKPSKTKEPKTTGLTTA